MANATGKMTEFLTLGEIGTLLGTAFVLVDMPISAAFPHRVLKFEIGLDLSVSVFLIACTLNSVKFKNTSKSNFLEKMALSISCLPLLTGATLYTQTAVSPIFLQVFRLYPLIEILKTIHIRSQTKLFPKRFKLIGASVIAVVLINALACVWLLIYPPGEDPVTDYIKAVYWLVTTIATVGYGDITPTNNAGRIYAIGMMILGATIWSIMIASASRLMLASDKRKELKKEKLAALQSFFHHYDIPPQLQEHVLGFMHHLWNKKTSEYEDAVLSDLPPAFQAELQVYMNIKPISRVSLFTGVSFECLSSVSKKLEQVVFSPGEKIIIKGDVGSDMFLIGHGTVRIHDGDREIATLSAGNCFGELALIGDGQRTSDVTAATYCDIFKLSKERFHELYLAHDDLRRNIDDTIAKRKKAHSKNNSPIQNNAA